MVRDENCPECDGSLEVAAVSRVHRPHFRCQCCDRVYTRGERGEFTECPTPDSHCIRRALPKGLYENKRLRSARRA